MSNFSRARKMAGGPYLPSARGRSGISCRVPGCEASFGKCGVADDHIEGAPYLPSFGRCGIIALSAIFGLLILTASCGYHQSGTTSSLPPDVKVLAIPSFQNQTHTYHLETGLTNAVIREFNTRTKYRIVQSSGTPSGQPDATLQGTVVSAQVAPVAYDSVTGRAATGLVTIVIKVTLTARDGRVLYSNPNYTFRDQYQISNELSSFFEEEGPALERLQRDFSRTLVSDIVEAF
jgi:outer membrane lipopolysaccharide assembly protein LptE/RlpB